MEERKPYSHSKALGHSQVPVTLMPPAVPEILSTNEPIRNQMKSIAKKKGVVIPTTVGTALNKSP